MRKRILLSCILLYISSFVVAKNLPKMEFLKKGDYFEVKTDHWLLQSWASRSRTLDVAKQIHVIRTEFNHIFRTGPMQMPILKVLVMKNEPDFLKYSKGEFGEVFYRGGYWSVDRCEIVTWDHHDLRDTLKIISHELTHYFTHQIFKKTPLWLNEGLAEYMASSVVRWGKLKGGYLNEDHQKRVIDAADAHILIPLEQLIRLEKYLDGHLLYLQYSEVWGLVHFLFHGERGKYHSRFIKYLMALKQNPDVQLQDFVPLEKIEKTWIKDIKHLKGGRLKVNQGVSFEEA